MTHYGAARQRKRFMTGLKHDGIGNRPPGRSLPRRVHRHAAVERREVAEVAEWRWNTVGGFSGGRFWWWRILPRGSMGGFWRRRLPQWCFRWRISRWPRPLSVRGFNNGGSTRFGPGPVFEDFIARLLGTNRYGYRPGWHLGTTTLTTIRTTIPTYDRHGSFYVVQRRAHRACSRLHLSHVWRLIRPSRIDVDRGLKRQQTA